MAVQVGGIDVNGAIRLTARLSIAIAGIAVCSSAHAQTVKGPNDGGLCEIHMWITENPYVTNAYFATLKLSDGGQTVALNNMRVALPEKRIFEIVGDADWTALTGLKSPVLIPEPYSHDSDKAYSRKVRATTSQAPCYFELRIGMIEFEQSVYGRKLRVFVGMTNYSHGLRKPKRFAKIGAVSLPVDIFTDYPSSLRTPFEQGFRALFEPIVRDRFVTIR